MISSERFCVKEANCDSNALVATVDMLPRKVLLIEKPILIISEDKVEKYVREVGELSLLVAGYDAFRSLQNVQESASVLALPASTTGDKADILRNFAQTCTFGDDAEEVELFVRVATIIKLYTFYTGQYFGIFATLARMRHSCIPNILYQFDDITCTCRVLSPVRAGEELTIEYSHTHRMEPIHIRRQIYAERKDFSCFCARCSIAADDTRQFDCFEKSCPGLHYVCQPSSQPDSLGTDCSHFSAQFVAPHLLPCTVCRRVAPVEHQRVMFELEEKLPAVTAYFKQKADAIDFIYHRDDAFAVIELIERFPFPRRHIGSAHLLYILVTLKCHITTDDNLEDLLRTARAFQDLYKNVARFPNDTFAHAMFHLCCYLGQVELSAGAPQRQFHEFLIDCCRLLLRMNRVIFGRDSRIEKIEVLLRQRLLTTARGGNEEISDPARCGFCLESATDADVRLNWCGRCLRVTYCSVMCQRAHWEVHKSACVAHGRKSQEQKQLV